MKKIILLILSAFFVSCLIAQTGYIELDKISTPDAPASTSGRIYMDTTTAKLFFSTADETYDLTDTCSSYQIGDTISIDEITHMLVDTLQVVFGKGGTVAIGDILGVFEAVQDSVIFDKISAECIGSGGDITLQLKYGSSWTDTATGGLHSALNVTTNGNEATTTSFNPPAIAPGNDIWCVATDVTTSPTLVILKLFYHEKRTN